MEPEIIHRDDHTVTRKLFSQAAIKVLYRLNSAGHVAYLAGGAVRDILLGHRPKDFDIVTDARPNKIKKVFRNSRMIGRRFRLAHIYFHDEIIECATFRRELDESEEPAKKTHFSKNGGMVMRDNVYGTPEQDALRRDFTVNALFYNIKDFTVIDYVKGMQDLDQRIIRCIGDPHVRYAEDPVRMIRALRFAAKLDFDVEQETYRAIHDQAALLANASPARMYEEVQKLFFCGNARKLIYYLEDTGLLEVLFLDLTKFLAENPKEKLWIERVAKQLDVWRKAEKQISATLLFALIFGPICEHAAERVKGERAGCVRSAAQSQLNGLRERIVIPNHVKTSVAHILADQHSLLNPHRRKKAGRFLHRKGFAESFIYFKLRSRHIGENAKDIEWWENRLKNKGGK